MNLPKFPLFDDPVRENMIEESDESCDFCEEARGAIYTGNIYGEADVSDLICCPWCIADGTAADRGAAFNAGDIYPVLPGTPQLTDEDRDLVEGRTPGFTSWQDHGWQICCGRACIYLGEADASDLRGRWASAISSMFAGDGMNPQEIDEIVDAVTRGGSPCGYVFRCQVCGGLKGLWDCD